VSDARTTFASFVAALGVCAIVGGFFTMEPAWIGQAQQTDLQRQRDLSAIANAIVVFKHKQDNLPYDLSKLAESPRPGTAPLALSDPETGQPYDYTRVTSHSYKLCAAFKLETLPTPTAPDRTPTRGLPSPWTHSAGTHCFVFDDQSTTPLPDPTQGEARS